MNSPKILSNVSLKPYNTFGIEVKANHFVRIKSPEDLTVIFNNPEFKRHHIILGGGSNVLFTGDFDGIVIKNDIKGINILEENDKHVLIEVGAGENWHQLVLYCNERAWGGIENLSLIPGTVGAAPMQNIGAYGVEMKNVFHSLHAYEIESGKMHEFSNEDCRFGYRTSIFKTSHKGRFVITHVRLLLSKTPAINISYGAIRHTLEMMGIKNPGISDVSAAVINIRSSKLPDPEEIGNAGSFFKNPVISETHFSKVKEKYPDAPSYPAGKGKVKVPAGWLIEQAGWKGKKVGNTGSHKDQALVLVNYGKATGSEIMALSEEIQRDIQNKFGIELEREVNVF